jgi:hypothetical protein
MSYATFYSIINGLPTHKMLNIKNRFSSNDAQKNIYNFPHDVIKEFLIIMSIIKSMARKRPGNVNKYEVENKGNLSLITIQCRF